ncbi:hypothetical protein BU17DRAFT_57471 [Hysterangium stoloniferum]|nr:hypothetical protein BU17DRAFT_57471 [Hysterangium stoloniferum]
MVTWLWGLVWGDVSTVSVVDRTPILTFNARPAGFGPASDVLGYMIRVEDFSSPCDDGGAGGSDDDGDGDGQEPTGYGDGDGDGPRGLALDPRFGCPRLCVRGPNKPEVSETWIALVMRGGCTFVDKVREAQRFGAKGVVVGGQNGEQDSHGDGLVQMYSLGDASDIKIPSTYITHSSYRTLSSLIASSNTSTWGLRTVSVGLTIDPSGWEWYSPIITFFLLLFLPSILTLFTLLIHRLRAARAARLERAPEDVVLNLPWRTWEGQNTIWELEKTMDNAKKAPQAHSTTSETSRLPKTEPEPSTSNSCPAPLDREANTASKKWYEKQVECAICLEDFVTGDKVRVLPCRHIFHMTEVDDWLIRRKKLCPICKHDVTLPLDLSDAGSHEPQSPMQGRVSTVTALSTIEEEDTEVTERTPLLGSSSSPGS